MRYRICTYVFAVFAVAGCVAPGDFAQANWVSIFPQAIDARNRGDLDGLMKFFASDAVREDGSCNPPCVGEAAVRRSFEKNIAEHFQASLTSVEGSGDTVIGRAEIRSDAFSVQTVLNVYGSRSVLLDLALDGSLAELRAQRLRAEPGDTAGGIAALVDHYEQFGDLVIRNLAEQADPELIQTGRSGHRRWVQRQFAPQLAAVDPTRRRTVVDGLVCGCDVYTWKLLRRDMDRSRSDVEATMRAMVEALVRTP